MEEDMEDKQDRQEQNRKKKKTIIQPQQEKIKNKREQRKEQQENKRKEREKQQKEDIKRIHEAIAISKTEMEDKLWWLGLWKDANIKRTGELARYNTNISRPHKMDKQRAITYDERMQNQMERQIKRAAEQIAEAAMTQLKRTMVPPEGYNEIEWMIQEAKQIPKNEIEEVLNTMNKETWYERPLNQVITEHIMPEYKKEEKVIEEQYKETEGQEQQQQEIKKSDKTETSEMRETWVQTQTKAKKKRKMKEIIRKMAGNNKHKHRKKGNR